MKFIFGTLLTAAFAYLASLFLPWWSVAVVAMLLAIVTKSKPIASFGAGFAAIFMLWGGYAYWLDAANLGLLSSKMGNLLQGFSSKTLITFTASLGGLLGGLGALTGSLGRNIFSK